MRRSISLYRRLIAVQLQSQLQYRVAFVAEVLISFFVVSLFFVSLVLVMQRFESIGGWRLGEVAFLYGLVEMGLRMAQMIFSGFDSSVFAQNIRLGSFDQLLLRPASPTLQVFGSRFNLRLVAHILQGLVIFGIALSLANVNWTPLKLLYLPLVIFSLVLFFGGFFLVGATITFWTVESVEAVNIFTYGGGEMMAYPMHIYPEWLRHFFTFIIPAIFLVYYPALFFLDRPDPFNMPPFAPCLAPVAGLSVFAGALLFWRFGLKHYQSTGS
jgi:ABC-2 type transport system permease protein